MKDNANNRNDEFRNLDDMFRQGLENLRPEPSKDLWKGINRKLWWDEISHFTFTNLSKALWIGGIAGMMMIVTALMVVVVPQTKSSDINAFTIINDPLSFNSNALYSPDSYSSDQAVETTLTGSDPAMTDKQSSNHNLLNTDILPSTDPDRELLTSNNASDDVITPSGGYYPSADNLSLSSEMEGISSMTSIPTPDFLSGNQDANYLSINPDMILNIPKVKPIIPKFFSLDFGVTPAVTVNGNTTSTTETNFSSDLGISYHIGRFSLRTGVGLSYAADDGIYRIEYKSKDSVGFYNMVTAVAVNQQDPKEIIYYTHRIVVYDSIEHIADDQTRYRYTYLQIPLLAGFRVYESERLGLTLQAGPMVSFLVREKEAQPVIDYPNATIIRIDNNTPARVKTNWQIWLGLRMDYKISKNFSFFAEPVYKYYFKPVIEQETTPVRNPYSLGIGIGIEYNFGIK